MDKTIETEAKFIVPDEETFARLRAAERLGPYTRREGSTKLVRDRYLDTTDRNFYKQKFYARLRESSGGDNLLFTLKSLGDATQEGAIHVREEYQTEVPGVDIASWPEGDVRRMPQEIAGDQSLLDLFTLNQIRLVSVLEDLGRAVAELSLDEILTEGLDGHMRTYELEIELLPDGTIADLATVSRIVMDDYGLNPQMLSKFERAMSLLVPETAARQPEQLTPSPEDVRAESGSGDAAGAAAVTAPEKSAPKQKASAARAKNGAPRPSAKATAPVDLPGPEPRAATPPIMPTPGQAAPKKRAPGVSRTDSMNEAGRKVIMVHFEAMLDNEEGTRDGEDPEALHDMRVATRRMRAAMRIFEPYLSRSAARRVQKDMRAVARALGAVRDLDVLIIHARNFRDELPSEQQEDLDGLLDSWAGKRDRARGKMLTLLDSKDYGRFKVRMMEFLGKAIAPPDQRAGAQPYEVRHVAGSAIWEHYEAVRAYETLMDQPTVEQLHALRITGKYLRYTLEFFSETLPSDGKGLIKDVVSLQDQLGELHDADVASKLIRDHVASLTKGKNNGDEKAPAGLVAYLAEREDAMKTLQADFAPSWDKISGAGWRTRLATLIASL